MDELSISPEELAKIMGDSGSASQKTEPSPPASNPASSGGGGNLSQEEINRMIAAQQGGGATGQEARTPAGSRPSPVNSQITPEELAGITGNPGAAARPGATARPAEFAPLQSPGPLSTNLDLLLGVTLKVTVELGRTKMNIEEVLKLGPGSVVELDKLAGEPVDVLINERMIARGEVVVIDDRFGVRITDVVSPAQRLHSLA